MRNKVSKSHPRKFKNKNRKKKHNNNISEKKINHNIDNYPIQFFIKIDNNYSKTNSLHEITCEEPDNVIIAEKIIKSLEPLGKLSIEEMSNSNLLSKKAIIHANDIKKNHADYKQAIQTAQDKIIDKINENMNSSSKMLESSGVVKLSIDISNIIDDAKVLVSDVNNVIVQPVLGLLTNAGHSVTINGLKTIEILLKLL